MSSTKCRLFVGNLAIFSTEEDIRKEFEPFGEIVEITIKSDPRTGKQLSYGFVRYSTPNAAKNALTALNGRMMCGRPLR